MFLALLIESHCGFDLPLSHDKIVPFGIMGGAPHHHLHHNAMEQNFAPFFTHWDRVDAVIAGRHVLRATVITITHEG